MTKRFSNSRSILASMSLEQKTGQMIMAGFHGTTPSSAIRKLVESHQIGGVILFSRNLNDPRQAVMLTRNLQNIALNSEHHLPLLVATDQEGGLVARIRRGTAVHPGNMALGATRSSSLAHSAGNITGTELRAMGINMNLAPVLDVSNDSANSVIGVRSFGEDYNLVSKLGVAMIRGLQKNMVIATAKHFPGHGHTSQDSHEVLPVLPHSLERLRQVELRPFRAAISSGVEAVMVGHLSIPAIDKTRNIPATTSRRVITNLLRQSLGHQGLVTTDCMEMKAITDNFEAGEAAVKAVKAGADLVLVSHTLKRQLESIRAILDAARDREIDQEHINRSVTRILNAKAFAQQVRHAAYCGIRVVGRRKHLLAVAKMAEKSITLTHNIGILPLRLERGKRILSVSFVPSSIKRDTEDFSEVLRRQIPRYAIIRSISCDPNPSKKQAATLRKATSWAELAIAATYDAVHNDRQARVLREIATHTPLVLVSMREPYDHVQIPEAEAHIAAYSPASCSVVAAVEAIVGRSRPMGQLPVFIPTPH